MFILPRFKSSKLEVLILRELLADFVYVFILRRLGKGTVKGRKLKVKSRSAAEDGSSREWLCAEVSSGRRLVRGTRETEKD
ncbi:MAG: hypothetical protein DMG31_16025 [Acidobacteria bacterium]|nr:MAG: hypothetical protein DMG31_16025 [Acidobacteriota bacterium]